MTGARRSAVLAPVLAAASVVAVLAISIAMDAVLLLLAGDAILEIAVAAVLFNLTCVLFAAVGALIELRRPGHRIGRLLMIAGPLYALLAAGWTTSELLEPHVDPALYLVLNWAGALLSYPGMALIAGWIPLLFPTGSLPGPRWRIPVAVIVVVSSIGIAAWAVRPGPLVEGVASPNPFGIPGWPAWLQVFVDAIPATLIALIVLGAAALVNRHRRGGQEIRLQVRWFLAAASLVIVGFIGVFVEQALRTDDGPLVSVLVAYAGVLAMPIAIGVAILRYRLYAIDRIVSRTIGWAIVTGVLAAVFVTVVVGLQAVLAPITRESTLAVAASTLLVASLFQPLRLRIQRAVDHRFNRARLDADLVASRFAGHVRDEVDLATLRAQLDATVRGSVAPVSLALWLRQEHR